MPCMGGIISSFTRQRRLTVGMGGRLWLWWGRQAMMGPFVSFAPSSSDSLAFGQDQTNSCGKNVDRDTVGRAVGVVA